MCLQQIGSECTLGHILSLWETISVELARQLTDSGQVRMITCGYSLSCIYIYSSQNPFQRVKDCFQNPLGDKSDKLTKALKSTNPNFLLRLLNKFIEIHIQNASAEESKRRYETIHVFIHKQLDLVNCSSKDSTHRTVYSVASSIISIIYICTWSNSHAIQLMFAVAWVIVDFTVQYMCADNNCPCIYGIQMLLQPSQLVAYSLFQLQMY